MGYWITTEHQQRDLTLEAEILTSLVAEGEVSKEWASHLSQAIEGGKIRGDVYISEEENEEGCGSAYGHITELDWRKAEELERKVLIRLWEKGDWKDRCTPIEQILDEFKPGDTPGEYESLQMLQRFLAPYRFVSDVTQSKLPLTG